MTFEKRSFSFVIRAKGGPGQARGNGSKLFDYVPTLVGMTLIARCSPFERHPREGGDPSKYQFIAE